MSYNKKQLILDLKNLAFDDLRKKYRNIGKFKGITISELIAILKQSELGSDFFVSRKLDCPPDHYCYYRDYDNNLLEIRPFYLLKNSNLYEVFEDNGRGEKLNYRSPNNVGADTFRSFNDLEVATFDFLDRCLIYLGYNAPDSIINSIYNETILLEDLKNLSLDNLREKYFSRRGFQGITIGSLVDVLKTKLGLTYFLSEKIDGKPDRYFHYKDYDGNYLKRKPFYLLKRFSKYEVFSSSDRGGKEDVCDYSRIEEAIFDFLDRFLTELGCISPDSKLNAESKREILLENVEKKPKSYNEIKLLLDIKKMPFDKLKEKYHDLQLFNEIGIYNLIAVLNNSDLGLDFFISKNIGAVDNALLKVKPVYLLSNDPDNYEVIGKSNENKMVAKNYNNIEESVFYFLDRYLVELGYVSPDSKINAPVY